MSWLYEVKHCGLCPLRDIWSDTCPDIKDATVIQYAVKTKTIPNQCQRQKSVCGVVGCESPGKFRFCADHTHEMVDAVKRMNPMTAGGRSARLNGLIDRLAIAMYEKIDKEEDAKYAGFRKACKDNGLRVLPRPPG